MKKVAVITGAGRGIGKAVSLALAEDGYHVVLLARSHKELTRVEKLINNRGGKATTLTLDVSDPVKVKSTIKGIIKKFKRIDVLFNNAGILFVGSIDLADDEMNKLIQINLLGAMYVAKHVAAQMKKQKTGYIINLSSIAGQKGYAELGCYCASKFGLIGFSESLQKELVAYGIKVSTICPSFVATDMSKQFDFPRKEMIQPKDIVKTVRYLLAMGTTTAISNINIDCAASIMAEGAS
jgi:3-oxoacyl-[acyl-carrier protein] reductase